MFGCKKKMRGKKNKRIKLKEKKIKRKGGYFYCCLDV